MERNRFGGTVNPSVTQTRFLSTEIETISASRLAVDVIRGPSQGLQLVWEQPILRCGTAADNDLMVVDNTVSRHHFRLELDHRGFRVRDLDSKNGVFLDGLAVRDAYLPSACKISVGDTVVRFRQLRERMEHEFARSQSLGDMVGGSPAMRHLFALIQRLAPTSTTVLIEGESGTGKELTANAIHLLSQRKDRPLEVVDCSAIPESIIESELFGHVRGAFTGATSGRKGLIEQADGGTLLLDEVGELPLALQGKILRLIERKEVRAVGDDRSRTVDIRILGATNRDLLDEVARGQFREDLYYRLAVVKLRVPSLRERPEDISLLAERFLHEFSLRDQRSYTLPHATLQRLLVHDFPGNVRELRNLLEQSCILGDDIPLHIPPSQIRSSDPAPETSTLLQLPYKQAKDQLVAKFEKDYWTRLLAECNGNISQAALRGGIHRKSLEYLLKKPEFRA
jgi:transcriptional regulator with PAS, ATPase and Fis domain